MADDSVQTISANQVRLAKICLITGILMFLSVVGFGIAAKSEGDEVTKIKAFEKRQADFDVFVATNLLHGEPRAGKVAKELERFMQDGVYTPDL